MQKAITDAASGGGSAADAFRQLGLQVGELAALKPDKQFEAIGKKIGAIADPTQRAAAAIAVFGKSGTDLLPMIESADELNERFRELGFTVTAEQVGEGRRRAGRQVDRRHGMLRGASVLIGSQLAPDLIRLSTNLSPAFAQSRHGSGNTSGQRSSSPAWVSGC